ncbi:MAG: hypothetical protein VYC09_06330, partial [Verrucomicrobiota bacterium]|nr:hypothetical protein [Verrucomicrobiota bacterium]
YDEEGKLIKVSQRISGNLKISESVKWTDSFNLTKIVSKPVSFKFNIEGDAKLYAIRFDDLFWD